MRKGLLVLLLLLITVGIGAAIYISTYLTNQDTAPDDSDAAATKCSDRDSARECTATCGPEKSDGKSYQCKWLSVTSKCTESSNLCSGVTTGVGECSGACESGSECNKMGNPSVGNMWSCKLSNGSYKCQQTSTNSGGDSCYLDCQTGWSACGCDVNACERRCEDEHRNDGPGTYTRTETCDGCGQLFTCSCSFSTVTTPVVTTPVVTTPVITTPVITTPMVTTPTNTPTETPTETPTNTPTNTPTGTLTLTPTLPETAIISDKVDRIIIGFGLLILGFIAYIFNFSDSIGKFFWNIGGKNILGNLSSTFADARENEMRDNFEKKVIHRSKKK